MKITIELEVVNNDELIKVIEWLNKAAQ